MVYFLVNNNYHITDFNNLYQDIKDVNLSLVQVPHTLNKIESDERFTQIYTYNKFHISFVHLFTLFRKNKKNFRVIDDDLRIDKNDILFAYTEYDLTNQYIIDKFNKSGAKVYLLEDGAATAYLFMSIKPRVNIKCSVKALILKLLYGLYNARLLFDGNSVFPVMKDNCISGVCFYLKPEQISRNIKAYQIKNNTEKIDLQDNTVIFLNQDIYFIYDTFEHYLEVLDIIIHQLSVSFDKFYFKFHPRETEDKINKIRKIVDKNNGIIIEDKNAIEDIIYKYKPKYAASFFSSSLISLAFMGIQPMFLYSFISNSKNRQMLNHFDIYLNSLRYNSISSIEQINSNYESGFIRDTQNNISIRNLIF
jgi:hypothetical protein